MRKGYIITADLFEVLSHKYGLGKIGVIPELISEIGRMEDAFIEEYAPLVSDEMDVHKIPARELAANINDIVSKIQKNQPNTIVVSLDRVYFPSAEFHLEITREVDPKTGESTGLKNRFNTKPINMQILDLMTHLAMRRETAENMQLILIDVGCFQGDTIKEVVQMLEMADGIVDLMESGDTIKEAHLKVIDVVLETSTKLIANKASYVDPVKQEEMAEVKSLLLGKLPLIWDS